MRKLTKVLSAVLLVAVVVSVMALLPTFTAFAEEESAEVMTPTTIFDAAGGKGSWAVNSAYTEYFNFEDADPTTKALDPKISANGVPYWTLRHHSTGGMSEDGATYVGDKPFLQVTPVSSHQLGAGLNNKGEEAEDAADFLVLDLDIGTESNPFSMIQFQTRFYTRTTEGKRGSSKQYFHQRIFANDPENVYFNALRTSGSKTYLGHENTADENLNSEWAHFTIIFDVRDGANEGYLYYNGEFVTEYIANTDGYHYLECVRILFGQSTEDVIDIQNESVNLANVTLKTFPVGYNGELATAFENIGNASYTLSDFSDLAYAMENLPVSNIAEITRGESTINVTSFAELEATVKPGDAVKLFRDVTRPIAIPENVTVDANGFNADKLVTDADWLMRYGNGKYINAGTQTYELDADGNRVLVTDSFSAYIHDAYGGSISSTNFKEDKTVSVTLLDDLHIKNVDTCEVNSRLLDFNLNNYTATMTSESTEHLFSTDSAGAKIIIRDGTFVCKSTKNLLYLDTNATMEVTNCTIISGSNPVLDQRDGTITFNNCRIESNISGSSDQCLSIKSFNNRVANANFIDCTIVSYTNKLILGATSVSSGKAAEGRGRYGGMQVNISFDGCTLDSKKGGSIMSVITYANEYDTASGTSKENRNYANVSFNDCSITTTATVVQTLLPTLYSTYTGSTAENIFASGLTSDNNISFTECTVDCAYLLTQSQAGYTNAVKFFGAEAVDGNYTYSVDLTFGAGNSIKSSRAIVHNTGADATSVSFAGENFLSSDKFNYEATQVTTELEFAGELKLAYSSDATYKFVVTDNVDTYSYKLGKQDPENFYWYKGEEVDIDRVVTLADSKLYTYSWIRNGSEFTTKFDRAYTLTPKANLTLADYIDYNLYIEKSQYDVIADYVTIDGAELQGTVTIDGKEYYKFQAKNINITEADESAITLTVGFESVYGDTFTKTNGVSILGYAQDILNKSTDEKSIALIQALLNYIVGACAYEADPTTAAAASALIDGVEFGTIAGEAKADALEGVEIALSYGNKLYVGIKSPAGERIKVSYTVDNQPIEYYVTPDESGVTLIYVKAYDLVNDITVTKGGESATFNIQGYYNILGERGETEAQAMVEAIYLYAKAAADYKATMQ